MDFEKRPAELGKSEDDAIANAAYHHLEEFGVTKALQSNLGLRRFIEAVVLTVSNLEWTHKEVYEKLAKREMCSADAMEASIRRVAKQIFDADPQKLKEYFSGALLHDDYVPGAATIIGVVSLRIRQELWGNAERNSIENMLLKLGITPELKGFIVLEDIIWSAMKNDPKRINMEKYCRNICIMTEDLNRNNLERALRTTLKRAYKSKQGCEGVNKILNLPPSTGKLSTKKFVEAVVRVLLQ